VAASRSLSSSSRQRLTRPGSSSLTIPHPSIGCTQVKLRG
jgi:hypothetical protein